jgi:two-component system OmpR family response regulator
MGAVGQRIVSELHIPLLAEAMRARGYALVLAGEGPAERLADAADIAATLRRWSPGVVLGGSPVPAIAVAACRSALAAALDAGAADAVADPVDPDELAARVDARVRAHLPRAMAIGDLRIDRATRQVWRAGHPIDLVPREFALLLHLAERRGDWVSRAQLLEQVWKLRFDPGTNVVAVHVSTLRAKVDRHHATPLIHGRKGLGYRLCAETTSGFP